MEGEAVLPRSILFLCGMNAIRSPMAEVIARQILPQGVFIASAGVRAGQRDPFVDAVLAEKGLSLGERQPQRLDDMEDDYFEMIVTLSPQAHHAALELTRSMAVEVEYWQTADPSTATGTRDRIMEAYRDVRDRLEARIRERFARTGRELPGN
jgi:protein-tyrosine-phosphatase